MDAEAYEDAGRIKAEIDGARVRGSPSSPATCPTEVGEAEIAAVIAARTGIPVGELVAGELERLQDLEADLHRARDRPGAGRRGRRGHDPARPRRAVRERPPARHVPVPRPDRRRQDRAGQGALGAAVRDREGAGPHRHVRVPRAAHGRAADRLAARLRRVRRRRPADRAGAPAPVLRDPARRDREGPPGGLERPAAADGRRAAHRRRGPDGRLHQRGDRHDLQPRRRQRAQRGIGFTAAEPAAEDDRMLAAAKSARSCPSSSTGSTRSSPSGR